MMPRRTEFGRAEGALRGLPQRLYAAGGEVVPGLVEGGELGHKEDGAVAAAGEDASRTLLLERSVVSGHQLSIDRVSLRIAELGTFESQQLATKM